MLKGFRQVAVLMCVLCTVCAVSYSVLYVFCMDLLMRLAADCHAIDYRQ